MNRQAVLAVKASVTPTVAGFLMILSSYLIQQDKDEAAKGKGNPYALGHWLGAKEKVELDLHTVLKSSEPADLEALKTSLSKRYHVSYMPAVRKVIRDIDKYLTTGKPPKYPVSAEVKRQIQEEKQRARAEKAQASSKGA
jgi:hypothetical protein